MNDFILKKINSLPKNSGVYYIFDEENTIIYVGKAKNLYNRVSQYFLRKQYGKVAKMVEKANDFDYTVTNNDKEALVLEMNMIHKYHPRYNILLKDDKHYPYIALSKSGNPVLKLARSTDNKEFYYFGPYPNSTYAYNVIKLLNTLFPFRKCRIIPKQPCLYFHLHQCLAPCINKIDQNVYKDLIEKVKSFLNGNYQQLYKEYENKMLECSNNLDFEKAKEYKTILDSIDNIFTKQQVEFNDKKDRDIAAFSERNGYLCIALLSYKKGVLLGTNHYVVERSGNISDQVVELMSQFYSSHEQPHELIINGIDIEELKSYLDCNVSNSTKGRLFEILSNAKINADKYLDKYFVSARLNDDNIDVLEELGTLLKIKLPKVIHLFDNSHIQGDSAVGALVVFINGEPNKKLYRKFDIKNSDGKDDLKSMEEVTYRHYSRLIANKNELPDLIILDGGTNQINAVKEVLDKLNININLCGLVKNENHMTEGIIDKDNNLHLIDKKSKLFLLLARMQDEIHRFAITFHRDKRLKKQLTSIFDDVPGLGIKRIRLLFDTFGTIENIKNSSIDELMQLIPESVAKDLYARLHK